MVRIRKMYARGKFALFLLFYLSSPISLAQQVEVQEELNQQNQKSNGAWGNCLVSDVWVLADYSGSMEHYESRVFNAVQEMSKGLLKDNRKARIGVMLFESGQVIVQTPTNDPLELTQSLDTYENVGADGGTEIAYALLRTEYEQNNNTPVSKFAEESEFQKIIILISDGEDTLDEKLKRTALFMKFRRGWSIHSIFVHRQGVTDEASQKQLGLLKFVSGNSEPGTSYIDSVLLDDLPEHFRKKFTCM